MLRIALPNKGSLSEDAVRLVKEAGYRCKRYGRELALTDDENQVEFIFLRPRDIAIYVSNKILDMGVTGRDLAVDSGGDYNELLPLKFAGSTFRYAVPKDSGLIPDAFSGLRIATSYPTLVRNDLARRGVDASVVRLDGAVEISIQLGVADAIADVVESGRTLKDAGLEVVGDPVLKSEAILITSIPDLEKRAEVKTFVERLRGIVVAREYVVIEYDCRKEIMDAACKLTPGIEAPTIAPLYEDGWVAVKSMVKEREMNLIMDQLSALGAKGIIVSTIQTCRI